MGRGQKRRESRKKRGKQEESREQKGGRRRKKHDSRSKKPEARSKEREAKSQKGQRRRRKREDGSEKIKGSRKKKRAEHGPDERAAIVSRVDCPRWLAARLGGGTRRSVAPFLKSCKVVRSARVVISYTQQPGRPGVLRLFDDCVILGTACVRLFLSVVGCALGCLYLAVPVCAF